MPLLLLLPPLNGGPLVSGGAGRTWDTTHADSAAHRAEPPKCIAKRNGAMRNPMVPIHKHSVMTKVGAHVCGCKVASSNARNKCYFSVRWHQVVFVKRQGPLHAPPRATATMVLGWNWATERNTWVTITKWKCIAKTNEAMRNPMGPNTYLPAHLPTDPLAE